MKSIYRYILFMSFTALLCTACATRDEYVTNSENLNSRMFMGIFIIIATAIFSLILFYRNYKQKTIQMELLEYNSGRRKYHLEEKRNNIELMLADKTHEIKTLKEEIGRIKNNQSQKQQLRQKLNLISNEREALIRQINKYLDTKNSA